MNKNDIPFDIEALEDSKLKTIFTNLTKTVAIFIATITISELLRFFHFDSKTLIMLHTVSILIASRITIGYSYSVLIAILNTFAYDFMITEPRMAFGFDIGFPITLCSMLLVAFSTSMLTIQMKNQTKLAMEREQRTSLLSEINQKLLAARDLKAIVKLTNEYLLTHVHRSVIFYTKDPLLSDSGTFSKSPLDETGIMLFISKTERERAHDVYMNPTCAEIFDDFKANVYYVPIISKEKVLGLIGVSCTKKPLSNHGTLFIRILAVQVALALELQYLFDEQNRILMEAEKEKTRATLLRAISHDLRTPLTSILGASSTILEQNGFIDNETNRTLIVNIKENAQWLIRIVENLLSITKISQDTMKLDKTLEAVEEVVAQAASIVRKRFPDCYIHIRSPEELLMVPMEATLISQVIINLLENSVKNTEDGTLILLDVKRHGKFAKFSVSDKGPGIPEQLLDNLFEVHTYNEEHSVDSVRGIGIGLSICKTIIHAHGGTITGRNKDDGGAYFSFLLPLKEGEAIERH